MLSIRLQIQRPTRHELQAALKVIIIPGYLSPQPARSAAGNIHVIIYGV